MKAFNVTILLLMLALGASAQDDRKAAQDTTQIKDKLTIVEVKKQEADTSRAVRNEQIPRCVIRFDEIDYTKDPEE
jgi:hypothetical protein